ncbi:Hypothetical protein FKW44_012763 [Caligus rogercresseyi]|uniref:Uncharacterized protein n=1 Tax=Caligus rogercresseyi TaxID=217165 RepID=A0A7T8HJU1_CALRO|nr:Hypothetical protein FKW44_012763 [Caligus rogercresseyi]
MTVTYSVEGDSGFVADIATEKAPESGAGSGYGAPVEPAYGAPPAPAYGAPAEPAPLPAYLPSYA